MRVNSKHSKFSLKINNPTVRLKSVRKELNSYSRSEKILKNRVDEARINSYYCTTNFSNLVAFIVAYWEGDLNNDINNIYEAKSLDYRIQTQNLMRSTCTIVNVSRSFKGAFGTYVILFF